jgi:hypothetical protein
MKDLVWGRGAEAFRVGRSGDGQGGEAVGGLGCCQAVVDVGGTVKANAGMPVFVVVPLHKIGQEASSISQGAEAFREGRGVLQGLKSCLAVGVVVRDFRA